MSFSNKHIFFDLDRTLWDFDSNSIFALNLILEQEGLLAKCFGFDSFYKVYHQRNSLLWKKYGKGKITKDELRIKRFEKTTALDLPDWALTVLKIWANKE